MKVTTKVPAGPCHIARANLIHKILNVGSTRHEHRPLSFFFFSSLLFPEVSIMHSGRLARNTSYERCYFWWIMAQEYPPKSSSCTSATPNRVGRGPGRPAITRGRPRRHGGRRSSSCSSNYSASPFMGSGPGRRVKTSRPPHGMGRVERGI